MAQRPDPADAHEQLLLQPHLTTSPVQPLGDGATAVVVGRHVGVQEQQGHAPDLGPPDLGVQSAPAREVDVHHHRLAVVIAQEGQRQPVGVEDGVGLLLPAVTVQALPEVAGGVEQTHTDDRHADVARRLEVVPGKDAETPGVLREGGGDAELRAEVGDRGRHPVVLLGAPLLEPPVLAEVAVEGGSGALDPVDERRVGCEPVELVR